MKNLLFSAVAVFGLAVSASAQAPVAVRPTDVKLLKLSPAVIKSPEYTVVNAPQKRSKPGDWFEVEAEFETAPELVDELTFNFRVVIAGKLLVGDVSYINIPKGREHYAVVYIPPRSLESALGGKQFNQASIGGIWVEVAHQGQVLGTLGLTKVAVPNLPQVTGQILNKSQTPFAPLYWDRYEAIKPATH